MQNLEKTCRLNLAGIIGNRNLHFILIGAGGTGGYLVPNLARQVSVINHDMRQSHRLTICDADEVEHKNLIRQNFIPQDINQNKAAVLAERYANAFGIEISCKDEYIENETTLTHLTQKLYSDTIPVIIGAVDNNKTRQMVATFFRKSKAPIFYVDSGNEKYAGQVVFGFQTNPANDLNYVKSHDNAIFCMPCVTDLYPDIADDTATKFVTEMSCDERAVHHPQSIACNITAANILFNYCNTLLNAQSMEGISTNAVTFNVLTNGFSFVRNTPTQIVKRYTPQVVVTPAAAG